MMAFNLRAWLYGLLAGIVLAAAIAAVPTQFDPFGPSVGPFHGARENDGWIFTDSFVGWFLPALVLVAPFTVLFFARREGGREGEPGCRNCK